MNMIFFNLGQGLVFTLLYLLVITQVSSQTWQSLGAPYSVNLSKDIAVGYSGTTRVLYIAAKEDSILKSTGSSISWTNMPFAKPDLVTCESSNPDVVYTGVTSGSTAGVWKSTDGGSVWSQSNSGLGNTSVTRLSISPFNNNVLYVGAV